jgi:hypothetical protein
MEEFVDSEKIRTYEKLEERVRDSDEARKLRQTWSYLDPDEPRFANDTPLKIGVCNECLKLMDLGTEIKMIADLRGKNASDHEYSDWLLSAGRHDEAALTDEGGGEWRSSRANRMESTKKPLYPEPWYYWIVVLALVGGVGAVLVTTFDSGVLHDLGSMAFLLFLLVFAGIFIMGIIWSITDRRKKRMGIEPVSRGDAKTEDDNDRIRREAYPRYIRPRMMEQTRKMQEDLFGGSHIPPKKR